MEARVGQDGTSVGAVPGDMGSELLACSVAPGGHSRVSAPMTTRLLVAELKPMSCSLHLCCKIPGLDQAVPF